MGRELAAAIGRWSALEDHPVAPELVGVCDTSPEALRWFDRIASVTHKTTDRRHLLEDDTIDVLYLAVPHHLHEELYLDAVAAGKDFLGEKPFGVDLAAAERIVAAVEDAGVFVRCSSEMPFFPGAQLAYETIADRRAGPGDRGPARLPALQRPRSRQADQLEAPGALLRSDRRDGRSRDARRPPAAAAGLASAHRLRRSSSDIVTERPDPQTGEPVPCDTIDNATLQCDAGFPLTLRTHRIAPGHMNTWRITATGMDGGVSFSTAAAQDRAPLRAARRAPGVGALRGRQPVGLRHRHRSDLRVRLRRRDPADVGRLPRRARGRAGRALRLRHARARRSTRTACSTPRCAPGQTHRAEPV